MSKESKKKKKRKMIEGEDLLTKEGGEKRKMIEGKVKEEVKKEEN